jgi:hypothetical protein
VIIRPARLTAVSVLVAATFGVLGLAVATPPASAATPCWRQILNEWVNTDPPQIATNYPLHCYREAIAHVPEDLRVYTNIEQDIMAARQQAARSGNKRLLSGHLPSNTTGSSREPKSGLYNEALNKLGPTNADSIPLPLLILAGLSLLMVATGGAGLLTRRLRARKVPG